MGEERQLSATESLKDVMAAAEFEEEETNTPPPAYILKGKKPMRPVDRRGKPNTFSVPKEQKYGPKYMKYPEEEEKKKPPPGRSKPIRSKASRITVGFFGLILQKKKNNNK